MDFRREMKEVNHLRQQEGELQRNRHRKRVVYIKTQRKRTTAVVQELALPFVLLPLVLLPVVPVGNDKFVVRGEFVDRDELVLREEFEGRGRPPLPSVEVVGSDRFVSLAGVVGPGESATLVGVMGPGTSGLLGGVVGTGSSVSPGGVVGPGESGELLGGTGGPGESGVLLGGTVGPGESGVLLGGVGPGEFGVLLGGTVGPGESGVLLGIVGPVRPGGILMLEDLPVVEGKLVVMVMEVVGVKEDGEGVGRVGVVESARFRSS